MPTDIHWLDNQSVRLVGTDGNEAKCNQLVIGDDSISTTDIHCKAAIEKGCPWYVRTCWQPFYIYVRSPLYYTPCLELLCKQYKNSSIYATKSKYNHG